MLAVIAKLLSFFGAAASTLIEKQGLGQGIDSITTMLRSLGPAGETLAASIEKSDNPIESAAFALIGVFFGVAIGIVATPFLAEVAGSAFIVAGLELVVSAGVSFALNTIASFLSDHDHNVSPFKFSTSNFDVFPGAFSSRPGENLIAVMSDPKTGLALTTLTNIPPGTPGVILGQVDVSLPGGQFLTLQKGSFSELANAGDLGTASTFTAFLQNSDSQNIGELKVNTQTNDVKFLAAGTDGTIVDLGNLTLQNGAEQLAVSLTSAGDPQIALIDAANGNGTIAGLLIHQNVDGSLTMSTNVQGASIFFGNDIDTLTNAGAGDTIFAGSAQYQMTVSGNGLALESGQSLPLPPGFVEKEGPISTSSGQGEIVAVGGNGQSVTASQANELLIAAGTGDVLAASSTDQTLVALGQSGDKLVGNTATGTSDILIADQGNPTTAPDAGVDTLSASAGTNVMIGNGVNTSFNINTTEDLNSIYVVYGNGGTDTLNITGNADIAEVNDLGATVQSIANARRSKTRANSRSPSRAEFLGAAFVSRP